MQKKIILFLVEGQNDITELKAILHTGYFRPYLLNYDIAFWKYRGDIFTKTGNNASNIKKEIENVVNYWKKHDKKYQSLNIRNSDIHEIVHILDTDGTFIPDVFIKKDEDDEYFRYADDAIYFRTPSEVVGRNRKKAAGIRTLLASDTINGIPYSMYYVSHNMDYFLFKRHVSKGIKDERKDKMAEDFRDACDRNPNILKETLFNKEINSECSYYESWDNIQEGINSLMRGTNFNLFFDDRAKNIK